MIKRILHTEIPSWTRWVVFAVFVILGGLWFSGIFGF